MIEKVEARRTKVTEGGQKRRKSDRRPRYERGLTVARHFTQPGLDPLDQVEWETRTAVISGEGGAIVFRQDGVEVPKAWSQLATNVVVQKYFRGSMGTPERERSVRGLILRVVNTLTAWGRDQGYFATDADGDAFCDELKHLIIEQKMSFNSPVWFNVGVEPQPQCSACFINSVEDTMESILALARTEGMLFKWGSGAGTNFSTLRSSKEKLNGGGDASGPVSFMKGFDAFAGVIKSGGKTRRAAKMVILNVDHPDILEFIHCKANEEKKAWALIDAGYDGSFTGEAYSSIFFQNSNNSVRVSDAFMEAVVHDRTWKTRAITTSSVVETHRAREIWHEIASAAHQCGDPGIQYDTTVNAWHTCPAGGRINASNPCSEFMFLDDAACNLASLNLRKFQMANGELDVEAFRRAIEVTILAQEIIVDNASYPTERIEHNSHTYRPLGLGYANLGALIMSRGYPYNSEPARALAASVTALMTGHAYATSARIARDVTGPFEGHAENRDAMLAVMRKHRASIDRIDAKLAPPEILEAARKAWEDVVTIGGEHGLRNAQVTVLAPTGTIGFMMDCDTTGIEPDVALVKYKKLVGGGTLKIVNKSVSEALHRLGYSHSDVQVVDDWINQNETIEGAPCLKEEHVPVFDCAYRPRRGSRAIHYLGHIRMMAAVQPFLSGAISKTVSLPEETTVEEIEQVYLEGWKLGLKAIAIYRDGCKRAQPVSTSKRETLGPTAATEETLRQLAATLKPSGAPIALRRSLPPERESVTHKFCIVGHEGYITVGKYEDGTPGEIFIRMAKEGSTVAGLMDCFATAISLALQHGVPLALLCNKFMRTRFDPAGFTKNGEIPSASSVMDYIFHWLQIKFLPEHPVPQPSQLSLLIPAEPIRATPSPIPVDAAPAGSVDPNANGHGKKANVTWLLETDAPLCNECGAIMVRAGSCFRCFNCGSNSGCG